jgi:hypothetical protein
MFYGILSDVAVKCESSDTVHAAIDLVVAAERGPAAKTDSVDFTYFIAVLGPGDALISKRSFGVRVAIDHNAKRGGVTDHFEETIALHGAPPSSLRIVVGFQQSAQAIDFYRHYRGR